VLGALDVARLVHITPAAITATRDVLPAGLRYALTR
jgi:hypothetical protein